MGDKTILLLLRYSNIWKILTFFTVITSHIFKKYSLIFSKVFWREISFSSTALYHFAFKNYDWRQSYQWVKICKHQVKWKYLNIEIHLLHRINDHQELLHVFICFPKEIKKNISNNFQRYYIWCCKSYVKKVHCMWQIMTKFVV